MQHHASSEKTRGSLILLLTAIIWGSSFVVVKNIVDYYPPHYLIAIRFAIGCAFLCIVFYRKLRAMTRQIFGAGCVIGLFLFGGYSVQTIGITDTTPGRNAFLTACYVIIVPFGMWLIFRKKPDCYAVIAAFLCILGIGLISLDSSFRMSFGDAMSLTCGFLFAGQIIAIARLARDHDPVLLCIVELGVCAVGGLIIALLSEEMPSGPPSAGTAASLLYLAVVVSALAQLMQNMGQRMVPASLASLLLCLESVFGVLFSVLFGAEALNLKITLGFVLVFIAILLSETKLSFLHRRRKDQ